MYTYSIIIQILTLTATHTSTGFAISEFKLLLILGLSALVLILVLVLTLLVVLTFNYFLVKHRNFSSRKYSKKCWTNLLNVLYQLWKDTNNTACKQCHKMLYYINVTFLQKTLQREAFCKKMHYITYSLYFYIFNLPSLFNVCLNKSVIKTIFITATV